MVTLKKIRRHLLFFPKTPYQEWLKTLRLQLMSIWEYSAGLSEGAERTACLSALEGLDRLFRTQLLALYDDAEENLCRVPLFSDIDLEDPHALAFLATRAAWLEKEAVSGQNHLSAPSGLKRKLAELEEWAQELQEALNAQGRDFLTESA